MIQEILDRTSGDLISGIKSGAFDKSDLIKMISQGAGGSLADKAGDLLKGGLGNLFK